MAKFGILVIAGYHSGECNGVIMIDLIIDYYKKNISYYSLVFKYFRGVYYIFRVSLVALVLSIVVFTFCLAFKIGIKFGLAVLLLCTFLFAIFTFLLNSKAKRVLKSKYGIISNNILWRCEEFEGMQDNAFIQFLNIKKLSSEKKIRLLIELLKNEGEKSRLPSFVAPSILLALFIPAWVQLMGVLYKIVNTLEMAIAITIGVLGAAMILVQLLGFSKMLYMEMVDPIVNRKNYIIKEVIASLETVLLRLPEKSASENEISPKRNKVAK